MNRNFTLCNDAPDALTGNAAARFGIAPAKADNPLSVSEIRGGGKPLICSELRLRKNNFSFSTHESHIQFRLGMAFACFIPDEFVYPVIARNEAIQIQATQSGLLRSATNDKQAFCPSSPSPCHSERSEESHRNKR